MWRANVRKLLENIGVWLLRPSGRAFTLGETGEAMIDDIVGKNSAVGYFAGFDGLKLSMSGRMPSASIAAIASSRV